MIELIRIWPVAALPAVLGVALWALLRPTRRVVRVSTLRFWAEAIEGVEASRRRRARRVTAGWVCLLLASLLLIAAACGPRIRGRRPARRVRLEVLPSGELAGEGMQRLRAAGRALLERLEEDDRVEWVLPVEAHTAPEFLTPADAVRRLEALAPFPCSADSLHFPPAAETWTARLSPAGGDRQDSPLHTLEIAPSLAASYITAAGVEPVGQGRVELFASVAGDARELEITPVDLAPDGPAPGQPVRVELPERTARRAAAVELPDADGYALALPGTDGPWTRAYLARRERVVAAVAIVGRDHPLLRRFVDVHPGLGVAEETANADLVFANRADAPPETPAVLIDPPKPPPGFRPTDEPVGPLTLAEADVAADHRLLAGLDPAGMAIRRVRPWVRPDATSLETVIGLGGDALVLHDPAADRLYIAFELSAGNTNFALSEAFVVFLANAVDLLLPDAPRAADYVASAPASVRIPPGWSSIIPPDAPRTPLGRPGLYANAGELLAVSPRPPRTGRPRRPAVELARELALPAPRPRSSPTPLGPWLIAVSGALMVAGWVLRLR